MTDKYDLIVFGASGFTGVFVVQQLISLKLADQLKFSFAVAGRDETKLKDAINEACKRLGTESQIDKIAVIIADVKNEKSLVEMASKSRVVINCVGPYRYYGQNVVRACIEAKAHYLDISGEPEFLETVQLEYDQQAKDRNVYVISSAGFDSVIADLGVEFMKSKFDGKLSSIKSYLSMESDTNVEANVTTWECAVDGFANADNLKSIRKKLYPKLFGSENLFRNKYAERLSGFSRNQNGGFSIEFPGSDRSVVKRTQLNNYNLMKSRPVDYYPFITVDSLRNVILMMISYMFLSTLMRFNYGRYLLKEYASFFTFGLFKKGGPKYDDLKTQRFKFDFEGIGWKGLKSDDPLDQPETKPTDEIKMQVISPYDPGYTACAILVSQSAITLLEETDKLPHGGGVFTPGTAFVNTSICDRISSNGIVFKLIQ